MIHPDELDLAIQNVVRDAISITEDHLLAQVARVFGFDRTGANIRNMIAKRLQQMMHDGVLSKRGDRIALMACAK